MLLRSITKHVKEQNWFAVALDFFIVVVGILLAFQITNWNEARSDRAEERKYLERLSSDLSRTNERIVDQLERYSEMMSDLDTTLKTLKDCKLTQETEAAFVSGLYLLGRYNLPEFVLGTFEELNATGNFQLIRNIELRGDITRVFEDVERINLIDRQINDRVAPKVNYVRRHVRFNPSEHSNRSSEIEPDIIEMDFEAICTDPVFINSVSAVREIIVSVDGLTKSTKRNSEDLKTAIDKELGRHVSQSNAR